MIPSSGQKTLSRLENFRVRLPFLNLGGKRLLAADFLGQLVLPYPEEGRKTQVAFVRPFDELDLDDELGLDPSDVALAHARHLRDVHERRVRPLERLQAREQLVDRHPP